MNAGIEKAFHDDGIFALSAHSMVTLFCGGANGACRSARSRCDLDALVFAKTLYLESESPSAKVRFTATRVGVTYKAKTFQQLCLHPIVSLPVRPVVPLLVQ